jgi:copper chaperone CopZ
VKTLAAFIAIMSAIAVSAGAHATDKPVVLKVSGMSCAACAKTVEKAAKKIDGVKAAKVSEPKGEAEITYDPARTSPEAIAKWISEKTGFKTEPAPKGAAPR